MPEHVVHGRLGTKNGFPDVVAGGRLIISINSLLSENTCPTRFLLASRTSEEFTFFRPFRTFSSKAGPSIHRPSLLGRLKGTTPHLQCILAIISRKSLAGFVPPFFVRAKRSDCECDSVNLYAKVVGVSVRFLNNMHPWRQGVYKAFC